MIWNTLSMFHEVKVIIYHILMRKDILKTLPKSHIVIIYRQNDLLLNSFY